MATESFYEMLEIDTPEKIRRLVKAFEDADARGPYKPESGIFEDLEEGKRRIRGYYQ